MTPTTHGDIIRKTLGEAGAGVQGNYSFCTGSHRQTGRFMPMAGSKPSIGEIGKLAEVEEEVIETICRVDLVEGVIAEIRKVHPYEEPAIDIIPRLEIE